MSQHSERLGKAHPHPGPTTAQGSCLPFSENRAQSLGSPVTWGDEICNPQSPVIGRLDRAGRPELAGCSRIHGKCTLGLWRGLRGQLGSTITMGTNCFWGPNSLFCFDLPKLHQPSSRRKCCKAVSEEKPTTSACLFSPGDAHYNFNWFAQSTAGETAVEAPNISIMLRFLQDWSQI